MSDVIKESSSLASSAERGINVNSGRHLFACRAQPELIVNTIDSELLFRVTGCIALKSRMMNPLLISDTVRFLIQVHTSKQRL